MTIRGLADRRQAKLTSVLRERERTDPSKSALNNPWTLCRGWSVLWNLPGHTDARFEHATCLLQNLFREFSPLNRRNGACLWQQTCCRKQSQMKTFWDRSSRVTRRGSMGMTRRRNFSLRSGSLPIPRGQRKRARCGQKSKSCSLFSLIWRALLIMITSHKAKL